MKKFKEILFLKNLKRVGNSAINGKYNKILTEANDLDDLILKLQNIETKYSSEDLQNAKYNAEKVFEEVVNTDIMVITIFDDIYPKKLNVMKNNKPSLLYVKGNVEVFNKPNIAIIGTRNPSELSQQFEENLVKNIVKSTDNVVVSGLALGCDRIAHQATVDENMITISILPSWIENVTPASNKNLAEDILKSGGCLISEYGPDSRLYKSNYTNRDKIVAAFCDATFVVECGVKSGTMHTVNAANDYKRQIYAYLPDERPDGAYDGNEFILNEFEDSIRVENIEDFINDLKTIKSEKQPKVSAPTLDDF